MLLQRNVSTPISSLIVNAPKTGLSGDSANCASIATSAGSFFLLVTRCEGAGLIARSDEPLTLEGGCLLGCEYSDTRGARRAVLTQFGRLPVAQERRSCKVATAPLVCRVGPFQTDSYIAPRCSAGSTDHPGRFVF